MSRTLSRLLLAPFFLLALAWPRGESGDGPAVPDRTPSVSAAELWAHPGRHLGKPVRFTVQHHSHAPTWNPFLTRFGSADFACVRAWGDEQFLWIESEFERPSVRFFIRRDGAAHWVLEEAERYRRFELTGAVRSVFGGVPWIEITGVKPLTRHLGEGTVIHASRAAELVRKKAWPRARSEFERALVGGLPEGVKAELSGWIARCDEEIANTPYRRLRDPAAETTEGAEDR
jgi:hypothetical protein